MEFDVKVFVNGKEVDIADLHKYEIANNKVIDRIVNAVKDRGMQNAEVAKFAS